MIALKLIQAGITAIPRIEVRFAKLAHPTSGCSSLTGGNEGNSLTRSLPASTEVETKKPKAPLKPFVRFMMKYRTLFVNKYPDASVKDIMKRLAMVWNQMSSEERSVYFDSYAKEQDEYKENLLEYRTHFNSEYQKYLDDKVRKQRNRDETMRKRMLKKYFKMPKRPANGFLTYAMERKKEENVITKTRHESEMWLTEMGKVWRQLPEKHKQKYRDKYHESLCLYEDMVIEWEKDVVEAGYAFLLPESKRIIFEPTNTHCKRRSRGEQSRMLSDVIAVDSSESRPPEE